MLRDILLVGLGGGAGSICRYLIASSLSGMNISFPFRTFAVNIIGCFIAGALYNCLESNVGRLLLLVGFCGGFTTFSSFALENIILLNDNDLIVFALYTGLSVAVGFIAMWAGMTLCKI